MPGLASSTRRQCHALVLLHLVGSGGRGPTSDMSPRSTFQNCGSSSRLVLRRKPPIGVTRGSLVSLNSACGPPNSLRRSLDEPGDVLAGAVRVVGVHAHVRNFSIVNGLPRSPTRVCLKKTGPGDVSRKRIAITANSGDKRVSSARLPMMSRARLNLYGGTSGDAGSGRCSGLPLAHQDSSGDDTAGV